MWKVPHPTAESRSGFTGHLVRAALVAAIGLTGSAGVAAASAVAPGDPFIVSPSEGGPFTVVSVSGADCTEGPAPSVAGTVVGSPEIGVITQFTATPDDNGDWTASFTVPPNKPATDYAVTATCKTDPDQADGDQYDDQTFTVVAGDEATMTVSPLAARAGQDVVVTLSGTLCQGDEATVDVGIFERAPEGTGDAGEFLVRNTAIPEDDGSWTTELTIPASASPGTYGVSGECSVGGFQFFLYETTDIVLSAAQAPPAVPVPGQPRLTG
ncbi:MAG: hypothetical protein ACRD2C_02580 [Acidimicrobiales bacterium]